MADDVSDKPANQFIDEPSPGERLRAARLEKKLDTKEVAGMLHVDPWMLDALEHDEYGALGAPVFAKGHLRKYATILGIEPDELLVGYYQRVGNRETPPLVAESILRVEAAQRPRFGWLLPVVAGTCVFGLIAFGAVLYLRTDSGPAPARADAVDAGPVAAPSQGTRAPRSTRLSLPNASTPSDAARVDTTQAPADPPAAEPTPVVQVAAVQNTPAPGAPPATAPVASTPAAQPASEASAAPSVTLMLRFDEESWVEVYDRDRAKLLYGLGAAGSTQYLSGPPPLQVFLGNAGSVNIQVDGTAFEIPRGRRRGNTARFVVDKPSP